MIYGLLALLGKLLAASPEAVPLRLSNFFGRVIFLLPRRRRILLSNLHHAFPERSEKWRRQIAIKSCQRTVEMALFAMTSPFFSEERIRKMFVADESMVSRMMPLMDAPVPVVALVPHFSLMEALTLGRVIVPGLRNKVEFGVFYRPLGSPTLERRVKESRERFGMRLLARGAGFGEANTILKNNGCVVILFDQNAGKPGALSLFLDRVARTSELAGLLAEKHRAAVIASFIERTGFWRGALKCELLSMAPVAEAITIAGNLWLEEKLRSDENICADWLWLHKRWKVNDTAGERFSPLHAKRNVLPETLAALDLPALPRRERFWISLPETLGDAILAVPLIRALREARPDATVSLFANAGFKPLLERLGIAEKIFALPENGTGWKFFRRLRGEFPDTHIVFTDTFSGDFPAWLAGAPQRFGIRKKTARPLLTHTWKMPPSLDATRLHKTRLWERWWQEHGLKMAPVLEPFRIEIPPLPEPPVGLVFDEKFPAETEFLKTLILRLLAEFSGKIRLFGVVRDNDFFGKLAREIPDGAIENFSGETDIARRARALAECRCVIAGDTDGMHIANMLGVPVVALFGMTNPLQNAPVFSAPVVILQPENCPPIGGIPVEKISPERVVQAAIAFIQ